MNKTDPVWLNLQRFANDHKIILQDKGEVGFGRPCVGFIIGSGYVNHNPWNSKNYEPIQELADDRLYAPDKTPDAYHKHNCLCVLVNGDKYDEALVQLNAWIEHLEAQGEIEIVEYPTQAQGVAALLHGIVGYAVTIKNKDKNNHGT